MHECSYCDHAVLILSLSFSVSHHLSNVYLSFLFFSTVHCFSITQLPVQLLVTQSAVLPPAVSARDQCVTVTVTGSVIKPLTAVTILEISAQWKVQSLT